MVGSAGEAKRKKRSNKSKVHSNNSPAEVSPVAVATEVNKQADAGEPTLLYLMHH